MRIGTRSTGEKLSVSSILLFASHVLLCMGLLTLPPSYFLALRPSQISTPLPLNAHDQFSHFQDLSGINVPANSLPFT